MTKQNNKIGLILMVLVLLPMISATTMTYDTDKNTVSLNYDDINRLTNQSTSLDEIISAYDSGRNGTLANISNSNVTVKYTYDSRNRVTNEIKEIDGYSFEKVITYDSMDRVTSFSGNEETINLTYGNDGLLSNILNLLSIVYNALGQVDENTYDNGLLTNYSYDENFRVTQIKTNSSKQLDYRYDASGNIIEIKDVVNLMNYTMTYDGLHRLISTNISDDVLGRELNYTYDAIGNLIEVYTNLENISYLYENLIHAPSGFDSVFHPMTTLIYPTNGSLDQDGTVLFNCSAIDGNDLINITLYGNWGGGWHANETKALNGTSDFETFTKTFSKDGNYEWNCLTYDNVSQNDWGNANWSFIVDTPLNFTDVITINEEDTTEGDIIKGENITFNATTEGNVENVWINIWDGIVGVSNVIWNGFLSLVSGDLWSVTVETNDSFPTGEVNYTVYANDSLGNEINSSGNFTTITPPTKPIILYPTEGEIILSNLTAINWTLSTDPDNESVTYVLQYSNDSGTSWFDIMSDDGYEDKLNDSSTNKTLEYSGNENKTVYLRIPKKAEINSAKLNLTGFAQ